MIDIEYWEPIVDQAARRICFKMDAWEELEDIQQEMWLAVVEGCTVHSHPSAVISRRLGAVGANWVIAQKNLGMTMDPEPVSQVLSSPLDRRLIDWALPQLPENFRNIIRTAIDQSDVWVDHTVLKEAFAALSEVVTIYEG